MDGQRDLGLHRLAPLVRSATLPAARLFLDAAALPADRRAALDDAVKKFGDGREGVSAQLLMAFAASNPDDEVDRLSQLGTDLNPSHSQWLALTVWKKILDRRLEAPADLDLGAIDRTLRDYVDFSASIGAHALDEDFAAGLGEPGDGTYTTLAVVAQWQRLKNVLTALENHTGDRIDALLVWARSVEPRRPDLVTSLATLKELQ